MGRQPQEWRIYQREVKKTINGKERVSWVFYLEYNELNLDGSFKYSKKDGKDFLSKKRTTTKTTDREQAETFAKDFYAAYKRSIGIVQSNPIQEENALLRELNELRRQNGILQSKLEENQKRLWELEKSAKDDIPLKNLPNFKDFFVVLYPTKINEDGTTNLDEVEKEYANTGKVSKSISRKLIPLSLVNAETIKNKRAKILCPYLKIAIKEKAGKEFNNSAIDADRTTFEKYFLNAEKNGIEDISIINVGKLETRKLKQWVVKSATGFFEIPKLAAVSKKVFQYYFDASLLETNPAKNIKVQSHGVSKKKYIFTKEEIETMFGDIDKGEKIEAYPFSGIREKLFFATMFYSGMRANEVRALRWDCVFPKYIEVKNAVKTNTKQIGLPKNGETRITIMFPKLRKALEWYCEKTQSISNPNHNSSDIVLWEDGSFVFGNLPYAVLVRNGWHYDKRMDISKRKTLQRLALEKFNHLPPSANWVQDSFSAMKETMGLNDLEKTGHITPHGLRHSIHSILSTMKMDELQIRQAFGWSDFAIQKKYFHQNEETVAEVQKTVETLLVEWETKAVNENTQRVETIVNVVGNETETIVISKF